jgi:hypothetical protein
LKNRAFLKDEWIVIIAMLRESQSLDNEHIQLPLQNLKPQSQSNPTLHSIANSDFLNTFSSRFSNLFMPIPQGSKFKYYLKRKKSFLKKDTLYLYQSLNDQCLLNGFKKRGKTGAMYLLGAEQDKIMYGTMEAKKDRTNFGLL